MADPVAERGVVDAHSRAISAIGAPGDADRFRVALNSLVNPRGSVVRLSVFLPWEILSRVSPSGEVQGVQAGRPPTATRPAVAQAELEALDHELAALTGRARRFEKGCRDIRPLG